MYSSRQRHCWKISWKVSSQLQLPQSIKYIHDGKHIPVTTRILLTQNGTRDPWLCHGNTSQRCQYMSSAKKHVQSDNDWDSRNGVYRATLFIAGACLVGMAIKTKTSSVAADDDEDADINTEHVSEMEEFYTGGKISYDEAVRRAKIIMERKKIETGCPGISIAVSVNGKTVWAQGFGYADVENLIPCTPETVLRIASISKPIAMVTVAKLVEAGVLDLDAPIQCYVPEFPEKTWNNKKVTITTRQLLSHLSGLRDYNKDYTDKKESKSNKSSNKGLPEEFLIKDNFKSVFESLELFKDDPLVHPPGSKFLYTSHSWSLISAIVEKLSSEQGDFITNLTSVLRELGMDNTHPEYQGPLVPNRGRHYIKNEKGRVINAPYVDLSYKWAGGGLISNVLDVVKFGNAMLYSYQADNTLNSENSNKESTRNGVSQPGYLKPETMKMMWTPMSTDIKWEGITNIGYGLGWAVHLIKDPKPFCKNQKFYATHSGGAVGASSTLLILPTWTEADTNRAPTRQCDKLTDRQPPCGVVVAIIANMISFGVTNTAYEIAELFERVAY